MIKELFDNQIDYLKSNADKIAGDELDDLIRRLDKRKREAESYHSKFPDELILFGKIKFRKSQKTNWGRDPYWEWKYSKNKVYKLGLTYVGKWFLFSGEWDNPVHEANSEDPEKAFADGLRAILKGRKSYRDQTESLLKRVNDDIFQLEEIIKLTK